MQAAHWAAAGSSLASDEPPLSTAPPAGGAVVCPSTSRTSWDFHLNTTVQPSSTNPPRAREDAGDVVHRGGCHCGHVRFEATAPASLVVWDCTCSDCRMRRNLHFVVPSDKLKLIEEEDGRGSGGADGLAEYRWGTGVARHLFCSRCGITPFYRPRSNPDGWAVTFQCLDPGTVCSVEVRVFDGQHWEVCITTKCTLIAIQITVGPR